MSVTWLDLEQGSSEWHLVRKTKRPASMSSWVTGSSPYNDIADAFDFFCGENAQIPEDGYKERVILAHGKRLEPEARAVLEIELGVQGTNPVGVRGEYLASFDFLTDSMFVDIKCPQTGERSKTWQAALRGEIEPHYADQLETQAYVSGLQNGGLFVYINPQKHILVPYTARDEAWQKIHEAWEAFFANHVRTGVRPGPIAMDNNDEWRSLAERYLSIVADIEVLEGQRKKLAENLTQLSGGKSAVGAGIRLSRERRSGTIDYRAACEELLPGVDLERFRSEPSDWYTKISPIKARKASQ